MSKRNISIVMVLVVAIAAGGSLAFWKIRHAKAKAVQRESTILKSLSPDDVALLIKSQTAANPEKAKFIVETPESRKAFLNGMREYLSLAARARRDGLGEDPNFRLNLQVKENGLLSELYQAKLKLAKTSFTLTNDQLKSFWEDGENQKQFNAEIDALYAVQELVAESMGSTLGKQPKPQGEGLEKAKKDWARARLVSQQARADSEFMQQKEVQLRLQVLEAGILSSEYLARYWKDKIKATDAEIKSYLNAHPEWDLKKKRDKAEMVLRRAKTGEDFAALAKEFSEDRRTKDKGGLYDSYELGMGLWSELEAAAVKMQRGQIADTLVETHDGYHIVQLVDKTTSVGDDGKEKTYISVRHILFQKRFEDPTAPNMAGSLPPPFKTPEEIAKKEIEKEKRKRFVDAIVRSENISVPDDFTS